MTDIKKQCITVLGLTVLVGWASAATDRAQGQVAAYASLVEATEEADGPSLEIYRAMDKELDRSLAGYREAIEKLSPRAFQKVVAEIEDAGMRSSIQALPFEAGQAKFLEQLDRDFVQLKIFLADSLSESSREDLAQFFKSMDAELESPETVQAFGSGKYPIWSSRAAADGGRKVGEVVGKPVGTVVGPVLGAVLGTSYIAVTTALRLPVYMAVKAVSGLGKGFYYAWAKTRPVRAVIGKWAKAGWTFVAAHTRSARDAVARGWEDVRKWLSERFGRGDDNDGDTGN